VAQQFRQRAATDLYLVDLCIGLNPVGGPQKIIIILATNRRFRYRLKRRSFLKGPHVFKNRFASAILMAATTLGTVSSGLAQKPAAGQQPGLGGPVIAGVCLLSREAVLANSKVGIAAAARLKQIADESQAEIDRDRSPIEADVLALRSTPPAPLSPLPTLLF
jgi:hypothetical protein